MLSVILLALLIGGVYGDKIAEEAVKVVELICQSNIAEIVRRELRNTKNEVAGRMLGHTIKARIKSKGVNVISLDAINEDTGDVIELNLTSEIGIDDSIRINDMIEIYA